LDLGGGGCFNVTVPGYPLSPSLFTYVHVPMTPPPCRVELCIVLSDATLTHNIEPQPPTPTFQLNFLLHLDPDILGISLGESHNVISGDTNVRLVRVVEDELGAPGAEKDRAGKVHLCPRKAGNGEGKKTHEVSQVIFECCYWSVRIGLVMVGMGGGG
jgi:hypothetical protein